MSYISSNQISPLKIPGASLSLKKAVKTGKEAIFKWVGEHANFKTSIILDGDEMIGITDHIACNPLFVGKKNGTLCVSASPADFDTKKFSTVGLQQIAMGGFTIGNQTIYENISSLKAGEIVIIDKDRHEFISWYRYAPNPGEMADNAQESLISRHNFLLEQILSGLINRADGRTIIVPLSAGLDSRAIISGLVELGYPNLKCFSYGLKGNHEMVGARAVAKKLGVEWKAISYSHSQQKKFFKGKTARDYFRFADRPDAIPFMQDVGPIEALKACEYVHDDCVLVNGNTGDYITGNHIPRELVNGDIELHEALINKHFSLWKNLQTPNSITGLLNAFSQQLNNLGGLSKESRYEIFEYETRQSKYVTAGQRAYDFFDLYWELPLWHLDYVKFWEEVTTDKKIGRSLFQDAMKTANWGGVWDGSFEQSRIIVPSWIHPLRALSKVPFVFSKKTWKNFDRRVFAWWIDPIASYAVANYIDVLRENRGFKSAISWHCLHYLKNKGISMQEVESFS